MQHEFVGEYCRLRPWRANDADSLVRHANNVNVARGLYDIFPHPYTHDHARDWLNDCLHHGASDPLRLAIEVDGEAAGGISLRVPFGTNQDCLDLGYWLGESLWGKGIATEAVRFVIRYAFETLHANRLEAKVYHWNTGSARVLEKCGFTLEGRLRRRMVKFGVHADQLVFGLLPEDLI